MALATNYILYSIVVYGNILPLVNPFYIPIGELIPTSHEFFELILPNMGNDLIGITTNNHDHY